MDNALAALANGQTLSTAEVTARLTQTPGQAGPGQSTQTRAEIPVSLG